MGRSGRSGSLPQAASGSGDSALERGIVSSKFLLFGGRDFVSVSAPFLVVALRDARLYHFSDKCGRQRLVGGELDGPFGCGEALEFVLERLDHRGSREQTAVIRERREPHQHFFVPERRNPIADDLGGLSWYSGPNRRANLVQGAAARHPGTRAGYTDTFCCAPAFCGSIALYRHCPFPWCDSLGAFN